jgi:hypothetical protein
VGVKSGEEEEKSARRTVRRVSTVRRMTREAVVDTAETLVTPSKSSSGSAVTDAQKDTFKAIRKPVVRDKRRMRERGDIACQWKLFRKKSVGRERTHQISEIDCDVGEVVMLTLTRQNASSWSVLKLVFGSVSLKSAPFG